MLFLYLDRIVYFNKCFRLKNYFLSNRDYFNKYICIECIVE